MSTSRTSPGLVSRWLLSALVGAAPIWLGGGLAEFSNGPLVPVLAVTTLCGALAQYWVLKRLAGPAPVLYIALGWPVWTLSFAVGWAFLLTLYVGAWVLFMAGRAQGLIPAAFLATLSAPLGALFGLVVGLIQRAVLRRQGLLVPLGWCWRRVLSWTMRAAMAVGWVGLVVGSSPMAWDELLLVSGAPVVWLLGSLLDAGDLVLPTEEEPA